MMLSYVVPGTSMEELGMVLLTIPAFFPIVSGLVVDPGRSVVVLAFQPLALGLPGFTR